MKTRVTFLILAVLFAACSGSHVPDTGIIPQPNSEVKTGGVFKFRKNTSLSVGNDKEIEKIAAKFRDFMDHDYGYELNITSDNPSVNTVVFVHTNDKNEKKGAYRLTVEKEKIVIESSSYAGLFYGMESLVQMLTPKEYFKSPEISCVKINDEPSFEWRGFMIDVSRHFFPTDSIKKLLDIMALHKMNKFHWHLTDALGWRIQIDKYPLLTEKGAWRVVKPGKKPWQEFEVCYKNDSRDVYGGFYTKDDIREIVKYASERYIDIIPEIEMPGHSNAALQCYPEYSCPDLPIAGVYCAGNDASFKFLENIITEVIELFPFEYIHVGGDEVWKGNWKKCPLCQKRMRDEHLNNVNELQSYFMKRVEKFIASKGKKVIGWDEILEGGVPPSAAIMSWRGTTGGIEAANEGHHVVMTPTNPCYFDYKQSDSKYEPDAWGRWANTVLMVYDFYPIPSKIAEDKKQYILGAQGNLWTEKVATFRHVQYMMLPRLSALAEAVWTYPENKDKSYFIKKLDIHLDRLTEMGYYYSESSFIPEYDVIYDTNRKLFSLRLFNELGLYDIRYTLDGTEPDINSEIYTGPILFDKAVELNAKCFRHGVEAGYPLEKDFSSDFIDKFQ